MSIFKALQDWMGSLKALILPKGEKLQFVENCSPFPKEIKKKSKFKVFSGSLLTLLAPRAAGSGVGGFRG